MKKYLFLVLIFFVVSCSKKDNCDNPIDCLAPATQTGAGTIGCLINGQPFSPGGSQFSGPTQQAFYQFVDGGYHFGLSANNRNSNTSINIAVRNPIEEDESYQLNLYKEDSNFGECVFNSAFYQTNEIQKGEITFTKFDDERGIVSGTFWFDAINEEGEVVEIREGRFDMKYY